MPRVYNSSVIDPVTGIPNTGGYQAPATGMRITGGMPTFGTSINQETGTTQYYSPNTGNYTSDQGEITAFTPAPSPSQGYDTPDGASDAGANANANADAPVIPAADIEEVWSDPALQYDNPYQAEQLKLFEDMMAGLDWEGTNEEILRQGTIGSRMMGEANANSGRGLGGSFIMGQAQADLATMASLGTERRAFLEKLIGIQQNLVNYYSSEAALENKYGVAAATAEAEALTRLIEATYGNILDIDFAAHTTEPAPGTGTGAGSSGQNIGEMLEAPEYGEGVLKDSNGNFVTEQYPNAVIPAATMEFISNTLLRDGGGAPSGALYFGYDSNDLDPSANSSVSNNEPPVDVRPEFMNWLGQQISQGKTPTEAEMLNKAYSLAKAEYQNQINNPIYSSWAGPDDKSSDSVESWVLYGLLQKFGGPDPWHVSLENVPSQLIEDFESKHNRTITVKTDDQGRSWFVFTPI